MDGDKLSLEVMALERKIKLLLGEFSSIKEENKRLLKENEKLVAENKFKEEQIKNFQNRIKISKIVDYMSAEGEKSAELKTKINEYIKEIDRCIAHLSK